jgi:hypothetical protein
VHWLVRIPNVDEGMYVHAPSIPMDVASNNATVTIVGARHGREGVREGTRRMNSTATQVGRQVDVVERRFGATDEPLYTDSGKNATAGRGGCAHGKGFVIGVDSEGQCTMVTNSALSLREAGHGHENERPRTAEYDNRELPLD